MERKRPGGSRGAGKISAEEVRAGRSKPSTDRASGPDSHAAPVDRLLERLDGVRECGPGRWMARCPAHEDRSPSLSLRVTDDGVVLLHDFGGCPAVDVLNAVGMSLAELFPVPLADRGPRQDRHHGHAARDALRILAREALLVQIAAQDLAEGAELDDGYRELLTRCASRIRAAREAVG